jgi:hypothetical protein
VTTAGASSDTKSVTLNRTSSWLRPQAPSEPPSSTVTSSVGIGARSASTATRAMISGSSRSLVRPSAGRGSTATRSARRSSSSRTAGTKVSISRNDETIPTAASTPKSVSAGTGLKMLVRNPTAVVTVASTSAIPTV